LPCGSLTTPAISSRRGAIRRPCGRARSSGPRWPGFIELTGPERGLYDGRESDSGGGLMILVTGATGNVGGELVRTLAGGGQPVRALTRDDDPRDFPPGVQQVAGDLNNPESMRSALSGATALFLYPGYQDMAGTLAEARRAGVGRVVMLS